MANTQTCSAGGSTTTPTEQCQNFHNNPSTCASPNCNYNSDTGICSAGFGSTTCSTYHNNPGSCLFPQCSYSSATGVCTTATQCSAYHNTPNRCLAPQCSYNSNTRICSDAVGSGFRSAGDSTED